MRSIHPLLQCAALVISMMSPLAPSPVHAAAPADTVYVDPQAGVSPLVSFITSAQHSLDGEIYLVSSKSVLAALEDAAARHVTVRINLEQHPYGTGSAAVQTVFQTLSAHGVQLRWTSSTFTYTHAKYLVEDNARAWIGTMNWTTSAFAGNREFGIVDTDPAVVSQAEGVFTADWAHAPYSGPAGALVLSPVNSRATLTALIAGAKHTLDVYAEEVQDTGIVAALVAAAHRGVKVRLVAASANDAAPLRAAGVQVLIKTKPYIHAKAVVADGAVVFIGSENISSTSLDKNREMGLVLRDPAAITAVEQTFAQDIGGAAVPVTGSTGGVSSGPLPTSTPKPAGGSGPAAAPTATTGAIPTTTPAPAAPAAGIHVSVTVNPTQIAYGTYPTVTIQTAPNASCDIKVVYSTGRQPTTYLEHTSTANASGTITEQGQWHMESKGSDGTVSATCTLAGAGASGQAAFTIV